MLSEKLRQKGVYWSASWNPIIGCSRNCRNCWARGMIARHTGNQRLPEWYRKACEAVVKKVRVPKLCTSCHGQCPCPKCYGSGTFGWREEIRWTGEVRFLPERLAEPQHWRKPRVVATCWLGDICTPGVQPQWIDQMLETMWSCEQHQFLWLTQRPEQLHEVLYKPTNDCGCRSLGGGDYLPNLWLGVTAHNQAEWDERVPAICEPSSPNYWPGPKWASVEPLEGPINTGWALGHGLTTLDPYGIGFLVTGCMTGPNRAHAEVDWFRSLRHQCRTAGIPFWLKQAAIPQCESHTTDNPNACDCRGEAVMRKVVKAPFLDGRQHLESPWDEEEIDAQSRVG